MRYENDRIKESLLHIIFPFLSVFVEGTMFLIDGETLKTSPENIFDSIIQKNILSETTSETFIVTND